MAEFIKRNFNQADDVMEYPRATLDIIRMDGAVGWRLVADPGWRYSESMGPIDGSDSCPAEHVFMMIVSGRLAVQMDDGTKQEFGPGDVGSIPPGHEAWVVGHEPVVAIGLDKQG